MREWDTLTGVLVVRDQAHLVRMVIESSASVIDRYHIIDNGSDDGTKAAVEEAVSDLGVAATVEERDGYAGRLFLDAMQEYEGEYVFRLEGDQVYWPDRLRELARNAHPGVNVSARVYMLRNYLHLQNSAAPLNANHPTIYPSDSSNEMIDGKLWPRSRAHQSVSPTIPPIGVNCKVLSPTERAKRWHRPQWWRWGNRDMEWYMELDDVPMPYQDHMTLEEYIWRLRDEGKGSAAAEWGKDRTFDSLAEMGEALVEWDIRENCQFYGGEYPPVLEAFIEEHGYGAGVI